MRWVVVVLWAGAALACDAGDTELIGRIEAVGAPVRLEVDGAITSIGLIDDWTLITMTRDASARGEEYEAVARWVSPEGVLGPEMWLGWARLPWVMPRWVRVGDALGGALWFVSDEDSSPPADQPLTIVRVDRGADTPRCTARPVLPAQTSFGIEPHHGAERLGHSTSIGAGDTLIAVGTGVSDACLAGQAHWRPFLLRAGAECDTSFTWVSPPGTLCGDGSGTVPVVMGLAATRIGQEIGLVYRPGLDPPPQWLRLTAEGTLIAPPVRVGSVHVSVAYEGRQPAIAVAGGRIHFTERWFTDATCHILRTARVDGTDARDMPWQPGCLNRTSEPAMRLQAQMDLFSVSRASVLVLSNIPNPALGPVDPADSPRVDALALSESGRRASEVFRVSGTSPSGYFRAASDGDDLAFVYADSEGWWLRHARWTTSP